MGRHSILWRLAIAVVGAAGALFALVWYSAATENATSLASQKQIARFVTDDMLKDLTGKLNLMLYWQEAFDKTVVKYDKADRKSTRLNSSHVSESRMPSSA